MTFEIVLLAIGSTRFYDIIIDPGGNQLAAITAVPTARGVLVMKQLLSPAVEYPALELDNRLIGDFPFIVYTGTSVR